MFGGDVGILRVFWSAFVVLITLSTAQAAATDCSGMPGPAAVAPCVDGESSASDGTLSLYRETLATAPADSRDGLLHARRAWQGRRALCRDDAACLQGADADELGRLTSLQADLRAAARDPSQLAAILRFRQTGQCESCNLPSAVLSHMQPARNVVAADERCSIDAVARGDFGGAKLVQADLETCASDPGSRLASLDWDRVRMRWADLRGIRFGGASLRGADLSGANLTDATLTGVDFSGANLSQATLIGAISPAARQDRPGASFANADMKSANLGNARLYGDFEGADLTGATLAGAVIDGYAAGAREAHDDARVYRPGQAGGDGHRAPPVRFHGRVNLTDADLSGAVFFGQTHMTRGGFSGAILCRTLLPDGALSDRDCY